MHLEHRPLPFILIGAAAHRTAHAKGFYDGEQAKPLEKIALVHAELSELVEVLRKPGGSGLKSEKCPSITQEEEEVADALIRILEYSAWRGLNIDLAVRLKMRYNENRPYKHGKVL